MQDTTTPPMVQAGLSMGKRLDVKATPTVILNGWRYGGPPSDTEFVRAIDDIMSGRPPYRGFPDDRTARAVSPIKSLAAHRFERATRWMMACMAILIVVDVPREATGQIITGRVLRDDSLTPVPTALVTATDRTGALVARSVSTAAGSYWLRLNSGGTYAIRATHIGSAPFQLSNIDVRADAMVRKDLVLKGLPLELAPLIARASDQCGVPGSESATLLSYWRRARDFIAAADSAATTGNVSARFAVVDGSMDTDKSHVVRNPSDAREVVWSPGSGTGALIGSERHDADSALPLELADPAVILSDDFVDRHCFGIDWQKRREGLIGIRFSPIHGTDSIDIAGTLWVDSATAAVRRLDFRFSNLRPRGHVCGPVARREVPACVQELETPDVSGQLEFLHLATGEWLVKQWRIQFAPDSVVLRTSFTSAPPPRNAASTYPAHQIGMYSLRLRTSEGAIATITRNGEAAVYGQEALNLLLRKARP